MDICWGTEIFYTLCISDFKKSTARKIILQKIASPVVKIAFDTRRVNQETTFIPRRGLQNFHRSESFVSEQMQFKIKAFAKLNNVLNSIKSVYDRDYQWQDSYVRVLYNSIQKGLRIIEKDGDFSETQPSMGSLDYLEELLYVRYRLTPEQILIKSEEEIKEILLKKEDGTHFVAHSSINKYTNSSNNSFNNEYTNSSITKPSMSEDQLINILFNAKASKDNPEVDRTITINIKDKFGG